jgi:hypothetical protein
MRYFILPPGVQLHCFDAAATLQTPLRRLTHLFKTTETPQPLEPLYRLSDALKNMGVIWFDFKSILLKVVENHSNKTLLSVKYINTSFKGYKRYFSIKSQFFIAKARLQGKHIGHL